MVQASDFSTEFKYFSCDFLVCVVRSISAYILDFGE